MSMVSRDAALSAWCQRDRLAVFSAHDRQVIEGTVSMRSLFLELALTSPKEEELYDAGAMLGRLIAQQRGSPTLASATMDNASVALGDVQAPWLAGARAAVSEGFSAELVEMTYAEALNAWEFPRCAVLVDGNLIAIAAFHPSAEQDVLAGWADRAAKGAALLGVHRALVDGLTGARQAIAEAFRLAGIDVVESRH